MIHKYLWMFYTARRMLRETSWAEKLWFSLLSSKNNWIIPTYNIFKDPQKRFSTTIICLEFHIFKFLVFRSLWKFKMICSIGPTSQKWTTKSVLQPEPENGNWIWTLWTSSELGVKPRNVYYYGRLLKICFACRFFNRNSLFTNMKSAFRLVFESNYNLSMVKNIIS